MPKRRSDASWNAIVFRSWLTRSGVSTRVAGNCSSRCRRVEVSLGLSLASEVASRKRYMALMERISDYAREASSTKQAAEALGATLRHAARKFAQYMLGDKALEYPRIYRSPAE